MLPLPGQSLLTVPFFGRQSRVSLSVSETRHFLMFPFLQGENCFALMPISWKVSFPFTHLSFFANRDFLCQQ